MKSRQMLNINIVNYSSSFINTKHSFGVMNLLQLKYRYVLELQLQEQMGRQVSKQQSNSIKNISVL